MVITSRTLFLSVCLSVCLSFIAGFYHRFERCLGCRNPLGRRVRSARVAEPDRVSVWRGESGSATSGPSRVAEPGRPDAGLRFDCRGSGSATACQVLIAVA